MRTLEPANRKRIGLMGLIVTVMVVGVGQTLTSTPQLFAEPSYFGQFTDSGQLNKGDKVRIAGVDVGDVEAIKIDGDHIVMKFSTGSNTIGTESRLAIKTDTILGKKVLEIEPRGNQTLRPNGTLPLGQSTTPYQIYDAFFDVTKAAAGWNIDTVKQSLHVLSETIDQTAPHLSAALDGVAKFSDTIGKRDEQITHLLEQANKIAGILGDRSQQVDRLFVNTNSLLAAFNQRSRAISALLSNVATFSAQVQNLINDNPNLNHVLEQLRTVSDLLDARKDDLAAIAQDDRQDFRGPQRDRVVGSLLQGPAGRTCCRTGSCSRSWMRRSRSAVSTRRTSGAVPGCRRSSSPTRTARGSPTVRRRPRRPCWKAPRIIHIRRWRPDRRARTRQRRSCCRVRVTRCRVRASTRTWDRSDRMGRIRPCPTWLPRRRTLPVCPRRREFRSPGDPGRSSRTCRAHPCRSRPDRQGDAPSHWDRSRVRLLLTRRRLRRQDRCRPDPRHRPGQVRSYRRRISPTQVAPVAAERKEVTRIEYRL